MKHFILKYSFGTEGGSGTAMTTVLNGEANLLINELNKLHGKSIDLKVNEHRPTSRSCNTMLAVAFEITESSFGWNTNI